jgi:DNA-binding response OmpR family regulator
MNVLLVEDESALADVLARNLKARGHRVAMAGTVEDAVLSMAEAWPDALILDINLPDGTGWEILRKMGSASRDRLRVVVISAAPISQKRIEEFRPAHAFVKPFPMDALVRSLSDSPTTSSNSGQAEEDS